MVTGNHGYRGDNLVTMVTVIDNDKKFSKRSHRMTTITTVSTEWDKGWFYGKIFRLMARTRFDLYGNGMREDAALQLSVMRWERE